MTDFEKCCHGKKLVKVKYASALVQSELDEAEHDLKSVQDSLNQSSPKWAIIQSYYSMFHAARALLLSKGLREKSHKCLCIGIRHLFVEQNLMSVRLVEDFNAAKRLREDADYKNQYDQESANTIFASAKEFLETAQRLLTPEVPTAPK